jgi:hypothetical protein
VRCGLGLIRVSYLSLLAMNKYWSSREFIGDERRLAVRMRAGHRCEYCRRTLTTFEVDHIVSRGRGGSNELDNLAAACAACNGAKGDRCGGKIEVVDPLTGLMVPFFHPRTMEWTDHFVEVQGEPPRGRSVTGRATAASLFVWRPSSISALALEGHAAPDQHGWLEAHRLACEWDAFDNELRLLKASLASHDFPPDAELERQLLELEIVRLHTEASPEAIRRAVVLLAGPARELLPTAVHRSKSSTVMRQLSTMAAVNGNPRLRFRYAWAAYRLRDGRVRTDRDRPHIQLLREMREQVEVDARAPLSLRIRSLVAGPSVLMASDDWRWAFHSADILASTQAAGADALTVQLLERLDRLLEEAGYGQSFDRTRAVMLARRRWYLAIRKTGKWDPDQVLRHVLLWRGWRLENEVRWIARAVRIAAIDPSNRSRRKKQLKDLAQTIVETD